MNKMAIIDTVIELQQFIEKIPASIPTPIPLVPVDDDKKFYLTYWLNKQLPEIYELDKKPIESELGDRQYELLITEQLLKKTSDINSVELNLHPEFIRYSKIAALLWEDQRARGRYENERGRYDTVIKQAERDYKEAERIARLEKESDLKLLNSDSSRRNNQYGSSVREMAEIKWTFRQKQNAVREELISKKKEEILKQYKEALALFEKEHSDYVLRKGRFQRPYADLASKYRLQRDKINRRLFKSGAVRDLNELSKKHEQEFRQLDQAMRADLQALKVQADALRAESLRLSIDKWDEVSDLFVDARLDDLARQEKEAVKKILRSLSGHIAELKKEREEMPPFVPLGGKEELLQEIKDRIAALTKQLADLADRRDKQIEETKQAIEKLYRDAEAKNKPIIEKNSAADEEALQKAADTLAELIHRLAGQMEQFDRKNAQPDVKSTDDPMPIGEEAMIPLGYTFYSPNLSALPKRWQEVLKEILKQIYVEGTSTCRFPVECHLNYSLPKIEIEYDYGSEVAVKRGLQAFITNCYRTLPPGSLRVSVFDSVHYSAEILGPLAAFVSYKNGIASKIPSDSGELRLGLTALAKQYRGIEGKIGTLSVSTCNLGCDPKERIPLRLLILNSEDEEFRDQSNGSLFYLVNNADRLGIVVIRMIRRVKANQSGSLSKGANCFSIKGREGIAASGLYWQGFQWFDVPQSLPKDFWENLVAETKKPELGTKYFDRFQMHAPCKSSGQRRPIVLPFAVDADDRAVSCSFEKETYAAYIMGAAGSGKSTLIHTLIAGLLMNYHPDEVELWLLDFKMLEFIRYVDCCPPHVKYLLLEKSEDLVFDIVDQLAEELERRQYLFSRNGWKNLTDVPLEQNIPAIFVIIDEFAQMSQILKETRGSGLNQDYTLKLENLLAKGRALGFKFIFASQTYTTGISGLTETACKQIQLRFALKSTPDEIKQTLVLGAGEIDADLGGTISSLPPYETLFKWRDEEGLMKVGHFRNMYTESGEIESLIRLIKQTLHPVPAGSVTDDGSYLDKQPILIDGKQPKTFAGQLPLYERCEAGADSEEMDESDLYIYPGIPCSFKLARPFLLVNGMAENILLAGGNRDEKTNVICSIVNSYARREDNIELWAHPRAALYRKSSKGSAFSGLRQYTDTADICGKITKLKAAVQRREVAPGLIVCVGYELFTADMELLGGEGEVTSFAPEKAQTRPFMPDLDEVMKRVRACTDDSEKRRIVEEYNRMCSESTAVQQAQAEEELPQIYDARADLLWVLRRASNYGLHFVFCFERGQDFLNLRMDGNLFRHKLLFSMSREEAVALSSARRASELEEGCFVYTNGTDTFTYRPHIYPGIAYGSWAVDEKGTVVPRA